MMTQTTAPLTSDQYLTKITEKPAIRDNSVAYFTAITDVQNPSLDGIMGSLSEKMTKQEFSDFCHSFAAGVNYVREKYGTQPASIIITDEDMKTPCANADTYSIRIPRQFIEDHIGEGISIQSKTAPFALNNNQMAMMYGVEEGYHVHQMASDPERAEAMLAQQTMSPDGSNAYDTQPLESEAKQVVHQAMIDLGFAEVSPIQVVNIMPEEMSWAKEVLRERTQVDSDKARQM